MVRGVGICFSGDWSSHGLLLYRLVGSMRGGLFAEWLSPCPCFLCMSATVVIVLCCVHHARLTLFVEGPLYRPFLPENILWCAGWVFCLLHAFRLFIERCGVCMRYFYEYFRSVFPFLGCIVCTTLALSATGGSMVPCRPLCVRLRGRGRAERSSNLEPH
ncbi:unnamed protein product [Ectocarpus fasciculatus]